ncbi:MAG: DNA replication and repair protein RecF, partial [Verrucomicrobiota bacterium]
MLSRLQLSQFRSFEQLRLDLTAGSTAIIGANAQGKTTLLEAVCVLLRLQSPRTSRSRDLIQFEKDGFGLEGLWNDNRLQVRYQNRRRTVLKEGEPRPRTRDYLEASGLVVWMGNDDLQLIRGPGSGRRRYLDFLASQVFPGYRQDLSQYEKALKARNALLREDRLDPASLDAYSQILIDRGEALTRQRRRLLDDLRPWINRAQAAISSKAEEIQLTYVPGRGPDHSNLDEALAATREREQRRGQTLVGPHRDDVEVLVNGQPASKFASEGQQRTLALALKLAQIDGLR